VFLDGALHGLAVHPDPVVGHPDSLGAALLDGDGDPTGVGVQRVLDELFDDAGGALDDFPRRDALDGRLVELPDLRFAPVGHCASLPLRAP
jgi:hypothetical protein